MSEQLLARAEAFEAADLAGREGLNQLTSAFQNWAAGLGSWAPLANFASLIGLDQHGTTPPGQGDDQDDEPPWWAPLVIGVAEGWFELDQRLLSSIREYVKQIPDAWRQNLEYIRILGAFYSVQARDWLDQHVEQPIDDFIAKLPALQEPGLSPDGPITEAMLALSALDSNGDPVSNLGFELVQLIDARGGVTVVFSDGLTGAGDAGVAPIKGMIWLPEAYTDPATQSTHRNAALVGHELAHVLQRDLPEFPDGWGPAGSWIFGPEGLDPLGFEYGSPVIGEFTLYMEVQSNIVQRSIEYDFLQSRLSQLSAGDPFRLVLENQVRDLADMIATYTGDPVVASAYVVQHSGGHEMYVGQMVNEVLLGSKVPGDSWQELLAAQGFSQEAIDHIEAIAATGTPRDVPIANILQGTDPINLPSPPGGSSTPDPTTPTRPPSSVHPD